MLTTKAYAKINLVLEVRGEYGGGYHRISAINQTIDLYDVVSIEVGERINLVSNIAGLLSPGNLMFRAKEALERRVGKKLPVSVRLQKNIPLSSGLGGGSSDVAALLYLLNEGFGLGLSQPSLAEVAATCSSDAPFFIYGGLAQVEGRGEKVIPLPKAPKMWVVIFLPPQKVKEGKTPRAYAALRKSDFTGGSIVQREVAKILRGEDVTPYNAFYDLLPTLYPGMVEYIGKLKDYGFPPTYPCGSGPALFSLFQDERTANMARNKAQHIGLKVYLASTI
jgi:4-diphosphocytidyl-2-C-methyl-D-erythritol kinase